MPADINTFDMLRPNVLQMMTEPQLLQELQRGLLMQARVNAYIDTVLRALETKAAPPMEEAPPPPGTGGSDPIR